LQKDRKKSRTKKRKKNTDSRSNLGGRVKVQ